MTCKYEQFIPILLGRGDGTFQVAGTYTVGLWTLYVLADDFNNDTKLDLAVINQFDGTTSILLGKGDGTF